MKSDQAIPCPLSPPPPSPPSLLPATRPKSPIGNLLCRPLMTLLKMKPVMPQVA
ncbi:unnamed protein product [Diplocarpon coronariae]